MLAETYNGHRFTNSQINTRLNKRNYLNKGDNLNERDDRDERNDIDKRDDLKETDIQMTSMKENLSQNITAQTAFIYFSSSNTIY